MPAISGPRSFESRFNLVSTTAVQVRIRVALPRLTVKVDRQEPAAIIGENRIDADDEFVAAIRSRSGRASEMLRNNIVIDRDKGLVRTVAALHFRFLADTRNPFVSTSWAKSFLAGLCVLPSPWEDVGSAAKQASEKMYLVLGRGCCRHGCRRGAGSLNFVQPLTELLPLSFEFMQALPDLRSFAGYGWVRIRHVSVILHSEKA